MIELMTATILLVLASMGVSQVSHAVEILLSLFFVFVAPIPIWLPIVHHIFQTSRPVSIKWITYLSVGILWFVLGVWTFRHQGFLFSLHFNPSIWLQIVGGISLGLALLVDWQVMKTLGIKRLMCWVEFKQEKTTEEFVCDGIYKFARHPRYVEYMLISLALGLLTGYIFFFGFFLYLIISFAIATHFEERELVQRFGDAYRDYQKRVPKFFVGI
jgi:protein-S-isoprenylcysteine O-methyltransferase Ste14